MNSTNFNVSGKNATASIFITISESQKEEAERVEYEIKNSHTSTEEEAENNADCDCCTKKWSKCQCICSNCNENYNICKLNCKEDDEEEEDEYMHDSEEEEQDLKDKYEQGLKDEITRLKYQLEENGRAKLAEQSNKYLMDELLEARKIIEKERLNGRNYEKLFNGLKDESETLQLSVTNHEKKYEWLQNLYCEEKQRRIDAYKENTELEAKVKELRKQFLDYEEEYYVKIKEENKKLEDENKELKKQLKEVSEEADMAVHNHSVDAKALFKEIAENRKLKIELDELKNDTCDYDYIHVLDAQNKTLKETIRKLHVSMSKMTKQYNKQTVELKEERLFRRDNEDNFFRLLDEHRRLEKVMKKVQI